MRAKVYPRGPSPTPTRVKAGYFCLGCILTVLVVVMLRPSTQQIVPAQEGAITSAALVEAQHQIEQQQEQIQQQQEQLQQQHQQQQQQQQQEQEQQQAGLPVGIKAPGPGWDFLAAAGLSNIHFLFSSSCHVYQKWQAAGVVHSHKTMGYPGRITEVLGCNDTSWAVPDSKYPPYRVIRTPDFSWPDYSPRNKPHGLLWVLQNEPDWIRDDELVVIIDPDQVLLRNPWPDLSIREGSPAAAGYAQGSAWMQHVTPEMCGGIEECYNITQVKSRESLEIGTPYVLHPRDFKKIVPLYAEIMDGMHDDMNTKWGWIVEMHAYTTSTLRAGLPHRRLGVMVSNVDDEREGWQFVTPTVVNEPLGVLHYCQYIKLDEAGYKWGKHDYHGGEDFLDCARKAPEEWRLPTIDEANFTSYQQRLDARDHLGLHPDEGPSELRKKVLDVRNFWLYKTLLPLLNSAFDEYHQDYCPPAA